VDSSRIAELLKSYIVGLNLPPGIYDQLGAYLALLQRWNAKTNLTAIRDPEQIVTRHFGESLFAAGVLFANQEPGAATTLADLGSGAGFPGLPIKLAFPRLYVTLIESQNKKATFLKEVIRALRLDDIEVYNRRAEQWGRTADVVTVRAVERFETVLPLAAGLIAPGGRLGLLIGSKQSGKAREIIANINWKMGETIPQTGDSVILVGNKCKQGRAASV
jgi:16S rRNA (guanine527-N7)-methyltransferase